MTYKQDRLALFLKFLKLVITFCLKEHVAYRQRLIYHQDLRINIDRNSKSQTHEHTAGISLYRLVDKVSNVRKFQNIIQSGINLFF